MIGINWEGLRMTSWEEMSGLIDRFGSEQNLASRIKRLRETRVDERGRSWSQQELARRMTDAGHQMTHTAIWKIENPTKSSGGRAIPIGEAIGFARVLGVTIAELLLPDDAVQDLQVWQRLTDAVEALNEVRSGWATYVAAIEEVRNAAAASPRLADQISAYRDESGRSALSQKLQVYVNDAADEAESVYREKQIREHQRSLPKEVTEGFAPSPAVYASDDALASNPLPERILEFLESTIERSN